MTLYQRISLLINAIGLDVKTINTNKQDKLVSATNIKTIAGIPILGSGDISINSVALSVYSLGTSAVSTSTTRSNVTGLSHSVIAGKKYRIKLIGDYQTVVTTTGGSLGFILSSGTGTVKGSATISVSQSTTNTDLSTAIRVIDLAGLTAGSFITSTGVSVINSPHHLWAELILNCTTSGVFQVTWGSEVASSGAQLNADTIMTVELLKGTSKN